MMQFSAIASIQKSQHLPFKSTHIVLMDSSLLSFPTCQVDPFGISAIRPAVRLKCHRTSGEFPLASGAQQVNGD